MNTKNLKRGNPETQFKSGREAAENGAKGGRASGESRRRHRELRELLIEELAKEGANGMSKEEYLVAKVLENHARGKLTFKDMKDLQDLLGESSLNVNVKSEGFHIEVSPEIAKMMKEDEDHKGV